jgi:hypothetical protein
MQRRDAIFCVFMRLDMYSCASALISRRCFYASGTKAKPLPKKGIKLRFTPIINFFYLTITKPLIMKKYLLSLLPVCLFVLSCVSNAQEDKLHHQAELQYDLWKEDTSAVEQIFTLKEDTITTIVCEGGTKLIIPAQAFVLEEDPGMPANGAVELRVLEVYQQGNMLRHYLTTQEKEGKLLESAGMVYLEAYAEGKKLRLKEGKEILLGFPKKENIEGASLFSGVVASGEALRWKKKGGAFDLKKAIINTYFGGDAKTNLKIVTYEEALARDNSVFGQNQDRAVIDPKSYPRALVEDEPNTKMLEGLLEDYNDYLFFSTPQLSWINCDRFVEEEVIRLTLNISGFPQNTLYYLVFEELNSVMAGYRKTGEPEERNPVFEQVPIGREVKLVVIFNRGGDYYLGQQQVIIEGEQNIELSPREIAKEDIRDYLQHMGKAEVFAASR